jgi:hypothetical protein
MDDIFRQSPLWLTKAAKALCFWIGYTHSQEPSEKIPELRLAGEFRQLVNAFISSDYSMESEASYFEKLLPKHYRRGGAISDKAMADLAIWKKAAEGEPRRLRYVIELKRSDAAKSRIESDLVRLAHLVVERPNIRCYLCVFSERHRPEVYVSESGKQFARKLHAIEGTSAVFLVQHVVKAAPAFDDRDVAHYGVLIEVFVPSPED